MADSKVTDLAAITSNTSGDEFYVSQGGVDKKITIDNLGITGTFTATLTATTPPTAPPTTTASYTINGDTVNLKMSFENVDTSGASGLLQITGAPAAISAAVRQVGSAWGVNIATSTLGQISTIETTVIQLRETDNITGLNIIAGTGKYLFINISYLI